MILHISLFLILWWYDPGYMAGAGRKVRGTHGTHLGPSGATSLVVTMSRGAVTQSEKCTITEGSNVPGIGVWVMPWGKHGDHQRQCLAANRIRVCQREVRENEQQCGSEDKCRKSLYCLAYRNTVWLLHLTLHSISCHMLPWLPSTKKILASHR